MVELTDAEADALYLAFINCAEIDLRAASAPKAEQETWKAIARSASFAPENILAQAQARSTF